MAWNRSRAKYGNRKAVIDGITFDSEREAHRYTELKILEKAGKITGLQLQREFELIPAQREMTDQIYTKGPNEGKLKPGKVIEHKCSYMADFVYWDLDTGKMIVDAPHIWNQNQGGIDDKWQADQPKQDLITLNWIATWKKRSD